MKCLLDNIYYEARGEPEKGQLLVAKATLNRAEVYGSVCAAVYEPYQFSWTMGKKAKIKEAVYEKLERVAIMSLFYQSPVYYFHSKQVKPAWAYKRTKIASIGNHHYYE
jgi:spore germination cell wall hydrolase CwlJ-like protein